MKEIVSSEEYQAAIPKHCTYQTADQHASELMLCWGLLASIKGGYEMKCGDCEIIVKEKVDA